MWNVNTQKIPIFCEKIGICIRISDPKNTDINTENTDIQVLPVGASKYTKVPLEKRVQFQKTAFYVLILTSLYLPFYLEK